MKKLTHLKARHAVVFGVEGIDHPNSSGALQLFLKRKTVCFEVKSFKKYIKNIIIYGI